MGSEECGGGGDDGVEELSLKTRRITNQVLKNNKYIVKHKT